MSELKGKSKRRELRLAQIVQDFLDTGGKPDTNELAAKYGVTQRTIERDIREIIGRVPARAVEDIHTALMIKIRQRVPEMSDKDLVKLAEFFLSKKSEVRADVSGGLEWRITVVDELEDHRDEVEAPPGAEDSPP